MRPLLGTLYEALVRPRFSFKGLGVGWTNESKGGGASELNKGEAERFSLALSIPRRTFSLMVITF